MRKLARVGRPASRSESSARTSGSRRSTAPRSAAARRTRPSSRCTCPACQPSAVDTEVSEATPSSSASSQWSSGWVPVSRSVAARSRSTYSVSRPTRSTCALPTSSSGSARSSQAEESSDSATPVSSRSRPNSQVFATYDARPKSARCSASKAQRTPDSRAQVSSCSRSSSLNPKRRRTGSARARSSTCVAGARPPATSSSARATREQRVGLDRRAVGEPDPQPVGGMAVVADHVAEPEPGLDQRARRCRCRGTSPARRAARGSGRRRAGRAAPRAARRPDGRRRGRRAPAPTGRRRRGRGRRGAASSAARSACSQPSRVVGGRGRRQLLGVGRRRGDGQRPLELARVAAEAGQQRVAHRRWWLSSAARSTAPRRPARVGPQRRRRDAAARRGRRARRASAASRSISVTDSRVWPNSESRVGRSNASGSSRSRLDGVAGGARPARAPSTRSTRRRQSSGCQARSAASGRPAPSVSRPCGPVGHQRRPLPGVRREEAGQPARDREAPAQPEVGLLAGRARARGVAPASSAQGSSRQASITSSSGQASASGAHGSSSRVPVISATSDPGERKSTAAQTPSPAGPAPSTWESRWLSHRSIPRAGTTTSSLANGSGSGVGEQPPEPVGQRVGADRAVQVEAHGTTLGATRRGARTRQPPHPVDAGAGADDV